jgi:hypothetical protein
METKILNFELFEKKTRKTEDKAIDDKYAEYVAKIKKMRVKAAKKFADKSIDISERNIRSKINRYEIRIAEKELEILRMRDQKLLFKKELKKKELHNKRLKQLKKRKKSH